VKKLRDIWSSKIEQNDDKPTRIDVLSWLSRATLDIIGLAGTSSTFKCLFPSLNLPGGGTGFNYKFDTLNSESKPNELNQAFNTVFRTDQQLTLLPVLRAMIPPLRALASGICIGYDTLI
jgi:hypothetical protein